MTLILAPGRKAEQGSELEANLGYTVSLCSKTNNQTIKLGVKKQRGLNVWVLGL